MPEATSAGQTAAITPTMIRHQAKIAKLWRET